MNNYEKAQRHMKAQLAGRSARVNGAIFEDMLKRSCDYYLERGEAKIEKTPEPMKPLGGQNSRGQFLACYTKQAQPDYGGTVKGGQSIYFEAKHTETDRIEWGRLTEEQRADLEDHYKLGALAYVLVSFGFTEFYRIPWPVWRDMKELFGHKHIKKTEIAKYRVPAVGGIIKFLASQTPENKEAEK